MPTNAQDLQFDRMCDEWGGIRAQRSSSERWAQRIAEIADDEARLRAAGRWRHGRSDFLGVIGKNRDELAHSRLIGWLLDPCGHHGLGTRMLGAVMEHIGASLSNEAILARARVDFEVPLAEGRLDIVVDGPGYYLVIENKVDASEGPDQCAYYAAHVRRRDRVLVFLTPDGRLPDAAPDFRPVRYRQIGDALERALASSPLDSAGRSTAVDYLRTLRREFR